MELIMFGFEKIKSYFYTPSNTQENVQNNGGEAPELAVAQQIDEIREQVINPDPVPPSPALENHEIRQIENTLALQMLQANNTFASEEDKREAMQLGAIAELMYKGVEEAATIQHLFDGQLEVFPTTQALGIKTPKGLSVQAFRYKNMVVIGMRGTELTRDKGTLVANLIADLGIGRHKTNEDLINSLKRVNEAVKDRYGYTLGDQLNVAESVINSRVIGHTDMERMKSFVNDTAADSGKTAAKTGIVIGGVALFTSLVFPPLAPVAIGATGGSTLLAGGTKILWNLGKNATIADGYPTTLSYIKTIDEYIMKLKEEHIRPEDTLVTSGHSLAGFLSGVIGYMHAAKAYSFNGPGVRQEEVAHIIHNLGIQREINERLDYRTIAMEGDFIGNLGERDGGMKILTLQEIFREEFQGVPACEYNSPLSHHGIKLICGVMNHMPVEQPTVINLTKREEN